MGEYAVFIGLSSILLFYMEKSVRKAAGVKRVVARDEP